VSGNGARAGRGENGAGRRRGGILRRRAMGTAISRGKGERKRKEEGGPRKRREVGSLAFSKKRKGSLEIEGRTKSGRRSKKNPRQALSFATGKSSIEEKRHTKEKTFAPPREGKEEREGEKRSRTVARGLPRAKKKNSAFTMGGKKKKK